MMNGEDATFLSERKLELAMEYLQSYCNDTRAVKCKEEDFQALKGTIQKIATCLNSNESRNRFLAHPSYTLNLIYALQTFSDRGIRVLIIRLLLRLITKSGFKKYAVSLIQKGLTRALFQTLFLESTENAPSEEFMLRVHQLLARLGPFDRRFGIRARLNQCLPITLCLLRSQIALLGSHFSTSSSGPPGSANILAPSASSCTTGTTASGSLTTIGPMGSALSTTASTMSSTLASAGSTTTPGAGPGLTGGTSHGTASSAPTATTTTNTIPNALIRQMTIVLRTIRLYVSGTGKNNASSLGRAGAICLILRLLVIVAGLPVPKSVSSGISPTMPMSKSTPGGSVSLGSVGCSGPSGSLTAALTGSSTVGVANTNLGSTDVTSRLGSTITANTESHTSALLNRPGTENGLVIGSPIVTAVTATASAAASLQRYRMRNSTALSRSTKGCAFPSGCSGSSSTSMGFLATTAASMLSTAPALIATGVRYHSIFLRLVINTLHSLIKWKHNATRAINAGAVSVLLDLFLDVHRCDLYGRRIPLQRSALACLKCLTVTRAGRKMFISCGGLHTLFAVCAGYVGPDPLYRHDGDGTPFHRNKSPQDGATSKTDSFSRNRIFGSASQCSSPSHRASSTISSTTANTTVSAPNGTLNVEHPVIHVSHESSKSSEMCDYSSPLMPVPVEGPSTSPTLESLPSIQSLNSKPSVGTGTGVAAGDSGFRPGASVLVNRGTKQDDLTTVLTEACMLLRRCCPRSRLPVATAEGIFRCPLRRDTPSTRWTGVSGDPAIKRETLTMSDTERSHQSEGRLLTRDTSLSSAFCSGGKKDERKSVRLSPRLKDHISVDYEKRIVDRRVSEHTALSNEASTLYTSNQANEALFEDTRQPIGERVNVVRPAQPATGRKRPTDPPRLSTTMLLSMSVKSKSVTTTNRPQRTSRQKANAIKPVNNKATCPGTKGSRSSTITLTIRRRGRPTWLAKRGTKSSGKMETKSETSSNTAMNKSSPRIEDHPWRSSTRTDLESFNLPKSQSTSKRPHSLLTAPRIALSRLASPSPHCQDQPHDSSVSIAAEFTHGSYLSPSDPSFGSYMTAAGKSRSKSVSGRSPSSTVLLDMNDDVDEDRDRDEDEDGHLADIHGAGGRGESRCRRIVDTDDDDDDGEDDLDDDDGREADSGLDEPCASAHALSVTDLIASHGRFFPEWLDFPELIPPSITLDQLTDAMDSATTDWPFMESDPGTVRQLDRSDESFDVCGKRDTQTAQNPDFSVVNSVEESPPRVKLPAEVCSYLWHARHTQALIPFQMIAYPDLIGAVGAPFIEPFYARFYNLGGDVPGTGPVIHHIQSTPNCCTTSDTATPASEVGNQPVEAMSTTNVSGSNHLHYSGYLTVPPTDVHGRNRVKAAKPARRCTPPRRAFSPRALTTRPQRAIHPVISNKSRYTEASPPRLPYSLIGLQHAEILDDVRRLIDPEDVLNRTVFDLDEAVLASVRSLQHRHLSSDSRPNSPRATTYAGRVPPTHPSNESEGYLNTSAKTTPNMGFPQTLNSQQRRTSPIPVRSAGSPESVRVAGGFPYLSDGCPCGGLGDCLLTNEDEAKIDRFELEKGFLNFESRFECGNLRKAIQVRQFEYDLILSPDVNTTSNLQWFYFRVSNVESGVEYRFNVINCEKPGSQYTAGMQPLLFSVREALEGRPYWVRAGTCVNYYRNHFVRRPSGKRSSDESTYHTATFHLRFPHTGDVCYLAYHYPYTYTRLLTDIARWRDQAKAATCASQSVYFRVDSLTSSVLENPVPLITVTAGHGSKPIVSDSGATPDPDRPRDSPFSTTTTRSQRQRPYIFLTARVHSGETNSSWVIQGLIDRLVSADPVAAQARQQFIFKIVPMLNPDGVICGNHRCSMAGKDLNRRWSNPSSVNHPTIYHTKKLLQLLHACNRAPFVFIDLHGHSRMKNVFLYGCSALQSWKNPDTNNPTYLGPDLGGEDLSYRHLAALLDELAPAFSKRSCSYTVSKAKETTARVAVWREFGVVRSYTIEATYCGVTRFAGHPTMALDPSKGETDDRADDPLRYSEGHQIGPAHLNAFGAHLLAAFVRLPTCSDTSLQANPDTVLPPGTPPQFILEVDPASVTDNAEQVMKKLPTPGSSDKLTCLSVHRSPALDSVCSISSGGSSAHSLCSSSGASLSARSSSSSSSLSSSSMTDG